MSTSYAFGANNSGFQAGNIYGPVTSQIHQHAPPERRETPPLPTIVIPFDRDTDFVERGAILDDIRRRFESQSRVALFGLGGIGKSQLAIEYAYRTREQLSTTWVFWTYASNAARFEESFREIADRVEIPGRQDLTANIFQLVYDWLCEAKRGKWVLILDNVDYASFLVKVPGANDTRPGNAANRARPLIKYLPQCAHGSILITTRSRKAALKLVEERNIITVGVMDMADALMLFNKKLRLSQNDNQAADLVNALDYIPLAIVQAAAYISQRGPRYSINRYLSDFEESEHKRTSLLNHENEQLRRDPEAKNSIIITWQISFEHLQATRSSAADLLSLMSFFDRQGISERLLVYEDQPREMPQDQGHDTGRVSNTIRRFVKRLRKQRGKRKEDAANTPQHDRAQDNMGTNSEPKSTDDIDEDILTLQNYSFISINMDGKTFEMHRLVQFATREWLKAHRQQEKWNGLFVKNLNVALPTGKYENWAICQELFPHAQAALAQKPAGQDSRKEWATIMYKAAWYAWQMGRLGEAERLSTESMEARTRIYGPEHENTLASMAMLGLAYGNQGRWDEAEKLEVQVMETRKTKLGVDHPSTLTSMANLASTYRNQGRWDAAEKLEVQVMETSKTKLGMDHPDTLTSMANLASTLWNQGRWDDAEKLEMQVMETRKTKLGVDHPDTLTSMANLASTYRKQGRWDDAEKLFVQVIETRKTKLGVDHPDTLTSMANLAHTWKESGRATEAIRLLQRCVQARKRVLGLNHPYTQSSYASLQVWMAEHKDIELSAQLRDTGKIN